MMRMWERESVEVRECRGVGVRECGSMGEGRANVPQSGMNENWPGMFDEYGVQFLILDRHEDGDLLNLFQAQPGWVVDFEDEGAVIFARVDCV